MGFSRQEYWSGVPLPSPIFCPRVSLSASLTKTTVAASAWRHGGHPTATGSSRLDRYVTRHCHGPAVCVRTPNAVCDFSHVQRGLSPASHLAALMLERWSRVSVSPQRPFPVQVPISGVLTRPCFSFKQRLGNFRESRYLDRAASGNPKELMDFFLGVWLRY